MASVRKRRWTYKGEVREAWIADYMGTHKETGEPQRKQRTFRRKKDADDWLLTARGEIRAGIHTPDSDSITVRAAGKLWIEGCSANGLEPSTVREYRNHLKLHINPLIGDTKLSQLTRPMVRGYIDLLLKDRSPAMTKKALTSLGSLVGHAQDRGLVAQNVARGHALPSQKRRKGRVEIPDLDEINALVRRASGRWRPFIVTALFTGLRCSELRALRWPDIDFDGKVLHVRRRADRWNEIGDVKSAAGYRDVPLSPMVLNTLRTWQEECPKSDDDLVFPNGSGNVENHGNIYSRGFAPLQIECGIHGGNTAAKGEDPIYKAKYGIHALRHAAASLFIQYAGYTPKKVQTVMGHSSIQVTFDTYGHLFPSPEDDQKAMENVEAKVLGCGKDAATA